MIEKTFIIVKPDGVCKRLIGKVLERLETAGFKIVGMKMIRLNQKTAEDFYSNHRGKFFFEPYVEFMISAPIIVCVIEGENAVAAVRKIIGNTDSKKAEKGTLRNEYGFNDRRNIIHASDSAATAKTEMEYFFKASELFVYSDDDWKEKVK
ncbi:MAG: Nucleoside diphosphate kinase [Elusimicrobia bacterium ADurb.Bin231]|nr:MAG: Nucleoside diphosphate kinase [Elusimicrobia bacterium ADurb.Bin231]